MIDLQRVSGFEWDDGNRRKSVDKHGVSEAEAEQMFFQEPLLIVADRRHSGQEPRFHALGMTEAGRALHVTFTLRQDATKVRVILARSINRKERSIYERHA